MHHPQYGSDASKQLLQSGDCEQSRTFTFKQCFDPYLPRVPTL